MYEELRPGLKKVYAKVRHIDDYHWEIKDGKIMGTHKKSNVKVVIEIAKNKGDAEKLAGKERGAIHVVAIPENGVFSIKNGTFVLTYRYLGPTLTDINDHVVWVGFKVVERDGKLIQEDFYEYLGGRLVEHIKENAVIGQDYVFWQFYRCEQCGKYVNIESVEDHLLEHGVKLHEKNEEHYEVFEINLKTGEILNKFGEKVKKEQLSKEAKELIRQLIE